jgi:hypothetical protein
MPLICKDPAGICQRGLSLYTPLSIHSDHEDTGPESTNRGGAAADNSPVDD